MNLACTCMYERMLVCVRPCLLKIVLQHTRWAQGRHCLSPGLPSGSALPLPLGVGSGRCTVPWQHRTLTDAALKAEFLGQPG